jgi:hypothetical protein
MEDEQGRALTSTSCNERGRGKWQDKTRRRNELTTMRRGREMRCSNKVVWQRKRIGRSTTRGRETMQQPTKRTNERTNEQTKRVQREVMTWQGEGMEAADSLPPKRPIPLP